MKVHIVFDGEYDCWSPLAAFNSKEKAEKFCQNFTNKPDIIEFNIDEIPDSYKIPKGLTGYVIMMDKEGNVDKETSKKIDAAHDIHSCQTQWTQIDDDWSSGKLWMMTHMFAKCLNDAIKVATQKRQELIAKELWCKDYTNFKEK